MIQIKWNLIFDYNSFNDICICVGCRMLFVSLLTSCWRLQRTYSMKFISKTFRISNNNLFIICTYLTKCHKFWSHGTDASFHFDLQLNLSEQQESTLSIKFEYMDVLKPTGTNVSKIEFGIWHEMTYKSFGLDNISYNRQRLFISNVYIFDVNMWNFRNDWHILFNDGLPPAVQIWGPWLQQFKHPLAKINGSWREPWIQFNCTLTFTSKKWYSLRFTRRQSDSCYHYIKLLFFFFHILEPFIILIILLKM